MKREKYHKFFSINFNQKNDLKRLEHTVREIRRKRFVVAWSWCKQSSSVGKHSYKREGVSKRAIERV